MFGVIQVQMLYHAVMNSFLSFGPDIIIYFYYEGCKEIVGRKIMNYL